MSRTDIYSPPKIAPETVARWRRFREEQQKYWSDSRKPLRQFEATGRPSRNPDQSVAEDSGRYYSLPPRLFNLDSRSFTNYEKPDTEVSLEWGTDSRYNKTARWEDGPFLCVAKIESDDNPEFDHVGKWDDKEPTPPIYRTGWTWPAKRTRPYRGSSSRRYWMSGSYDTWNGKPGDSRTYRYRHVPDFKYDEERRQWWLLGYTKREADLLARQDVSARLDRLDDLAKDNLGMVGVVVRVYLLADAAHDDELGMDSLWGIESDSGDPYFSSVALDCAAQAISDAREEMRERIARYQLALPGITP